MRTIVETALQGETLDALVWRVLGAGSGTVETVLDLNRGIADIGAILPEGFAVTLPVAAASPVAAREIVQLWD
ncbi:tail protein X [Asticcacaulis endophyticus]|uniref:Tail protein n=1 Tax=Asticcacaulis endophyticus TaxID=1395890 RepID=A0A918UTH8_9CAUL|nr:tail protein X [Asticcacaulis endophyticus]GGZ32091.1 tail protein [Asticcacaulis endophyticus]